ncbi:MAG: hypothetical protein L0J45_08630 [Psychroflexus sp.]|nr:hypothetical protein [Psychroflexus sp.]
MKIRSFFLLSFVFMLTQSCHVLESNKSVSSNQFDKISLHQYGEKIMVEDVITIAPDEFSFQFYNKMYKTETQEFYAIQLASFLDVKALEKVKIGQTTAEVPFFEPGSGMAPHASGQYDALFLDRFGHHYLFYEDADKRRLDLIQTQGEQLQLEFVINALSHDGKEEQLSETDVEKFYIVIFIDRNLNKTIDERELYKLAIQLQSDS